MNDVHGTCRDYFDPFSLWSYGLFQLHHLFLGLRTFSPYGRYFVATFRILPEPFFQHELFHFNLFFFAILSFGCTPIHLLKVSFLMLSSVVIHSLTDLRNFISDVSIKLFLFVVFLMDVFQYGLPYGCLCLPHETYHKPSTEIETLVLADTWSRQMLRNIQYENNRYKTIL